MRIPHLALAACAALALAGCSKGPPPLAEGSWTLDNARSHFSYVTVKAGTVAEANSFDTLSGSVAADGAATLEIDLSSVDTGVDIRNQRMREVLFDVAANPKASVTAKLDPASFDGLGVGQSKLVPISATLDLHGMSDKVDATLDVTRAGPDTVVVSTAKPIIIDAAAFGLGAGVEKLRELANLPAITPVVPVSFTLTYTR